MNFKIEKILDRILLSKNWNNILLRNDVREDILDNKLKPNESFDERIFVEYLHNLDNDQLIEIRKRIFKLARDHYFETLIKHKFGSKPVLRQVEECKLEDNYALKCNLMKDCVECLEFMIKSLSSKYIYQLPQRCTEYSSITDKTMISFPLGKAYLLTQLNAIKNLRYKILKHQTELENLKRFTNGMEKLEKNLIVVNNRLMKCKKQNQILKSFLTILLILLITLTVLFLFLTCFTKTSHM